MVNKTDPYADGYNQGFDDYKAGKKRKPHALKNLKKLVMMRSQDVERYVQAYHQGYEAAVRKSRLQSESRQASQQRENPEEQINRRMNRLRSLRKKRNRGGPEREL